MKKMSPRFIFLNNLPFGANNRNETKKTHKEKDI